MSALNVYIDALVVMAPQDKDDSSLFMIDTILLHPISHPCCSSLHPKRQIRLHFC